MSAAAPRMEGRVRVASLLVLAGLVVELASLAIKHPAAFVLFATVGVALVAAGLVLFLIGLVFHEPR